MASGMRNFSQEYQDNEGRKYSYDFDTIIRRYLLRTLAPHFARDGSVLELGCHKGDMTAQILDYFPAITAIEAAAELADGVRERFPGRVERRDLDVRDRQARATFRQHLPRPHARASGRPGQMLRADFRQWLSPSGRLFVAVPNANALSRQIAVRMGLIDYNAAVTPAEAQHGHRCTYSMDVLLSQLRRAGYRLDDYGGVLVKPLANFQFDKAIAAGIVNEAYIEGCHKLAKVYPDLSASLFAVCSSPA